jgi:hypothetical protein
VLNLIELHGGADRPAAHWRAETLGSLADAAARSTPGTRQRIDWGCCMHGPCVRPGRAGWPPTWRFRLAAPGRSTRCCRRRPISIGCSRRWGGPGSTAPILSPIVFAEPCS